MARHLSSIQMYNRQANLNYKFKLQKGLRYENRDVKESKAA